MQVYFFVSGSMDYVLKPFEINVTFVSNPYKCLLFSANVSLSHNRKKTQKSSTEHHAIAYKSSASVISSIYTAAFIILTSTYPDKASPPLPPGRFYEGQMKHN